ncbi:MAG TPA: iron-sulfur cluster repair di-iron protein [Candidatus Angelobacter sp.]|nr:iron-sulfur cluster repair di-iron protein [Candidatus Angelobacter sp.]
MNLDPNTTVREFAISMPNATRLFEQLGIDYCCGGARSLRDACTQIGMNPEDVLQRLQENQLSPAKSGTTAPEMDAGLAALVEYIVAKHHGYLKQEIPRIQQLLKKVVAVHGKGHSELLEIQQVFSKMSEEMAAHMMKEERILFPYVVELEAAVKRGLTPRKPMFGTVSNPVHMMELEHDSAGAALKAIRTASQSYSAPEDACFSYKTLYSALQEFEADMHQHVHLENNVLFPGAINLEQLTNKAS